MVKGFLFIAIFFCVPGLSAQQNTVDTSSAAGFARHLYDLRLGHQLGVYTGSQFYAYAPGIEGSAFFSPDWQKGTVSYDGVVYTDIVMKYDLVKDQLVVTPDQEGGIFISLFSPRVTTFSFGGKTFTRIPKQASLPEGFYQQLVAGTVSAFARRTKQIQEKVSGSGISRSFGEQVQYYVLRDGSYHPVRKTNDLLNILKEYKKEVQQHLAAHHLSFRDNPEQTMIAAIEFYNQRRD